MIFLNEFVSEKYADYLWFSLLVPLSAIHLEYGIVDKLCYFSDLGSGVMCFHIHINVHICIV